MPSINVEMVIECAIDVKKLIDHVSGQLIDVEDWTEAQVLDRLSRDCGLPEDAVAAVRSRGQATAVWPGFDSRGLEPPRVSMLVQLDMVGVPLTFGVLDGKTTNLAGMTTEVARQLIEDGRLTIDVADVVSWWRHASVAEIEFDINTSEVQSGA